MNSISVLTDDAILYILQHLQTQDRIAFAYACQRLKQICMYGLIFRKVDLSGRPILRMQRSAIQMFFRDKQLAQHIRELNLSNHRVLNWEIDDQLEEFIMSICPHLEALHVINCGMSFQRLHRILKQAPKLVALSWSLEDLTPEDVEFLEEGIQSSNGICLKNIKHLHIETFQSLEYIQILKYLVLWCCKDVEELGIYIWKREAGCLRLKRQRLANYMIPAFLQQSMIPAFLQQSTSVADVLQRLHSLIVVELAGLYPCSVAHHDPVYMAVLRDFIFSVMRKKSRETKWKKLWLSPVIRINRMQDLVHLADSSLRLCEIHPHELHSIEAITAHAGQSQNTVDDFKTLFQRIDDNTVRSLHLCQPSSHTRSILELCEPILRVGGQALKFLSLSGDPSHGTDAVKHIVLHTLLSNCSNITELDLLYCYFEKDICEPLSKLRHLTKVQLMECAISSKHCKNTEIEISKANLLTFVENCKKITHFDVHGCGYHEHFSCRLTDGDLLALAKLRNLKSLTLLCLCSIREWKFLQNISECCGFLSVLRICAKEHFNKSSIPILMECAKFLKHFALNVPEVDLGSEGFWNLLGHAINLERLCIRSHREVSLNIPLAVETVKHLPRLHVLHLHCAWLHKDFHSQMMRMLENEKSDRRFFFEFGMEYISFMSPGSWISKKPLPLNEAELCLMTPVL